MFYPKYYSLPMAPSRKQNISLTLFELFYYSIAEAADDMEAFTQLTDNIFQIIMYSPAGSMVLLSSNLEEINRSDPLQPSSVAGNGEGEFENFVEAKKLLSDILNRRLFKIVTETQMKVFLWIWYFFFILKEHVMRSHSPCFCYDIYTVFVSDF